MGGAPSNVVTWRGVTLDPTTRDLLVELARISGDIYVEPIPGYGSYRNNDASGGTDTGGGHCDLDLEGRTDAEARTLETLARSLGAVAYFRPRVSPTGYVYGWQRHLHIIRRDCADLSQAARDQVVDYDEGRNGLANNGPDTGSRAYVGMTWARYLEQKENTMTPEQEKRLLDAIATVPGRVWSVPLTGHDEDGAGGNPAPVAPALSWLVMARRDAGRVYWQTDTLEAQVAGLRALLGDLDATVDEKALALEVSTLLAPTVRDALLEALPDDLPTSVDFVVDDVLERIATSLSAGVPTGAPASS